MKAVPLSVPTPVSMEGLSPNRALALTGHQSDDSGYLQDSAGPIAKL